MSKDEGTCQVRRAEVSAFVKSAWGMELKRLKLTPGFVHTWSTGTVPVSTASRHRSVTPSGEAQSRGHNTGDTSHHTGRWRGQGPAAGVRVTGGSCKVWPRCIPTESWCRARRPHGPGRQRRKKKAPRPRCTPGGFGCGRAPCALRPREAEQGPLCTRRDGQSRTPRPSFSAPSSPRRTRTLDFASTRLLAGSTSDGGNGKLEHEGSQQ